MLHAAEAVNAVKLRVPSPEDFGGVVDLLRDFVHTAMHRQGKSPRVQVVLIYAFWVPKMDPKSYP